jgi:hypothetical protein
MADYEMVDALPDLISAEEYDAHPTGNLVRIQISAKDGRLEILGDSMRPELIEKLLETLGPEVIEQMLCG